MTDFTTAQLQAVGIATAALDSPGSPEPVLLEFLFDGSKRSTAATDTIPIWDLPAFTGMQIFAGSVKVLKPGTTGTTMLIQLATVAVTGLSAWAMDAVAGTELVKLATGANTVVNTGTASTVRMQIGVGGAGNGVYRVRVWAMLFQA